MWRNHLIKGYMADYYNYIDAPFEREGIADTLHTIMHALKKLLRDRLPEDLDTQYGLRHYIASHFDGDISGWRPNLMFYLAAGWSYHSGSMYYPIPSHIPEKTAEDIYYDDVPKWDGKALWYRRALASYIFTRAHGLLQIIEPDLWESEFGVQWWERQLPILESIYRVLRKVDWLNGDIPRGYAYSSIYDYIIYNMDNEKLYFQGIDIYWWVIALQWGCNKHSGDPLYPVPDPSGQLSPFEAYLRNRTNVWSGEYGKMMRGLAEYTAINAKVMAGTVRRRIDGNYWK